MKLKPAVLDAIKDSKVRAQLVIALGVTDQTIQRYIKENSDDLTKAAALVVIRKSTGLKDAQILDMNTIGEFQKVRA